MSKSGFSVLTRSASSPLQAARNTTLNYLAISEQLPPITELISCNPAAVSVLFPGVRVVIQLLLLNSMRCQELLNVTAGDELKPSMFLVYGLKRSYSYSVHIPITSSNTLALSLLPSDARLFPFSYHSIWRAMSNAGLGLNVLSRVNRLVTHRSRYELAAKLVQLNERSKVTPLLRHKSKRTRNYYCGVLPK